MYSFTHKPHSLLPVPRGPLELAAEICAAYIDRMVMRNFGRGRPLNTPAAFIHPCQPIVAKQPPSGAGWAHELKRDGYRLQIHVRDGRVRLFTINGADWSKRGRAAEVPVERVTRIVLSRRRDYRK